MADIRMQEKVIRLTLNWNVIGNLWGIRVVGCARRSGRCRWSRIRQVCTWSSKQNHMWFRCMHHIVYPARTLLNTQITPLSLCHQMGFGYKFGQFCRENNMSARNKRMYFNDPNNILFLQWCAVLCSFRFSLSC